MDSRYKKKNMKFTHSEVSRNSRMQETLGARESSRFERFSMLRSFEEENLKEDKPKGIVKPEVKRPQSRTDMLLKWKEEKQIKKELDAKIKKPFYVGCSTAKCNPNVDLPAVGRLKATFNSTNRSNSRLVPPSSLAQPAKTMNASKQIPTSATFQSGSSRIAGLSGIPNNFGLNKVKTTQIKFNSGHKAPKTFGNSVVPSASQNKVKTNEIKFNGKTKTPKAFGNSVVSSGSQGPFQKTAISSKAEFNAKSTPSAKTDSEMNEKSKNVKKLGIPTVPSNRSKGIPAPKSKIQKPVTTSAPKFHEKKPVTTSVPKLHEKKTPSFAENVTNRRFGFKPAFNKQTGTNIASNSGSVRLEEKKKNAKSRTEETLCKQNSENDADVIFNCDISIIKNCSSFAPANFTFVPPAGLPDFSFNDKEIPIISRTSTPSKSFKKSCSPVARAVFNDSLDIPLEVDITKIREIVAFHKKALEERKELKIGNKNLVEEIENPTEVYFPANNVNVNKIEDISPKCTELLTLNDEQISGMNHQPSREQNEKCANALEDVYCNSSFDSIGLKTVEEESSKNTEVVKLQNNELIDGMNQQPSKEKREKCANELEVVCTDSSLDNMGLKTIEEESSKNMELIKLQNELIDGNDNLLEENEKPVNVPENTSTDSLDIIDLNESIDLFPKHEELIKANEKQIINDQQDPDKCMKKSSNALAKRRSILKSIPVLNSIAEIGETDEYHSQVPVDSPENIQNSVNTSCCSPGFSKLVPEEENSVHTPRRSLRIKSILARKGHFEDSEVLSPQIQNKPRRSMRLIDLNTPKKEINSPRCSSNITADFEKLSLEEPENINPNAFLIDFECSLNPRPKSKKVSLLYSPETVASVRKSIRGDLMSFSPNT